MLTISKDITEDHTAFPYFHKRMTLIVKIITCEKLLEWISAVIRRVGMSLLFMKKSRYTMETLKIYENNFRLSYEYFVKMNCKYFFIRLLVLVF